MRNIAVCFEKESSRSKFVLDILKDDFSILEARSKEDIYSLIEKSFNDIAALILDNPSSKNYSNDLLKLISQKNNYMFSLPVLVLTDKENMDKDDKFLEAPVVGTILEGESKKIILYRLTNSIKLSDSTSFDEFSNMLTALPSLIYLKDTQGRYAFCSQHWHHLVDKHKSIRGLTDFDIRKDQENARIAQESDQRVVRSGKGTSYVIKEEDEEGKEYLQIIKEPLKNEKGDVTGIIAIINNVTNEELLKQELRKKSITDTLTGLFNREYFEELSGIYRDNIPTPLTIISADCDKLKKINDKYGHAAGDIYICFARDCLKECLPKTALLFRMGGDEFIALLPKTTREEGKNLVKKIASHAKNYRVDNFSLKLSVGGYTLEKKNVTLDNAIALSDKEMYKMKKRHSS